MGLAQLAPSPAPVLRLRLLRASDLPFVQRVLAELSAETLHRRFLGTVTAERVDLSWVAQLGGVRHVAVGACLSATGEPLGVARAVVAGDWAELAVTVVDRWQGRRVGTRLAQALAAELRSRGVRVVVGTLSVENRPAVALLHGLGARRSTPIEAGIIEMRAKLDVKDGDGAPASGCDAPARSSRRSGS